MVLARSRFTSHDNIISEEQFSNNLEKEFYETGIESA